MKTFRDLEFKPHPIDGEGIISRIQFDNGYGTSVVRHEYSYGGKKGMYELAVLDNTGEISYSTSVASDVVGWLTESDVTELMEKIQKIK